MKSEGEDNFLWKKIAVAIGIISLLVIFLILWTFIMGGYFVDPDHKIEFTLRTETNEKDHRFSLVWKNQSNKFEGEVDWFVFDIEHDRSYPFEIILKNLTDGSEFHIIGELNVTTQDGLLVNIIKNDMGNFTLQSNESEWEILINEFHYEIYLSIEEYSDVV